MHMDMTAVHLNMHILRVRHRGGSPDWVIHHSQRVVLEDMLVGSGLAPAEESTCICKCHACTTRTFAAAHGATAHGSIVLGHIWARQMFYAI